jgi:hypothetical protein
VIGRELCQIFERFDDSQRDWVVDLLAVLIECLYYPAIHQLSYRAVRRSKVNQQKDFPDESVSGTVCERSEQSKFVGGDNVIGSLGEAFATGWRCRRKRAAHILPFQAGTIFRQQALDLNFDLCDSTPSFLGCLGTNIANQ